MKKFLLIICSLAILATCGVTTAFASAEDAVAETANKEDYVLGDMNGDGKIDAKDATMMLITYANYLAAISYNVTGDENYQNFKDMVNEKFYQRSGDIDGDGIITSRDTVAVLIYYAYVLSNPNTTIKVDEYWRGYNLGTYEDLKKTDSGKEAVDKMEEDASEELEKSHTGDYSKFKDEMKQKIDEVNVSLS